MNIDLFLTGQSEAAMVCDSVFKSAVAGIILDAQTQEITLELADGGTFHCNIPMEAAHREKLLFAHRMYVGFLEAGLLTDAQIVPLLYLNDPYGSDFGQSTPLNAPQRAVTPFEQFMKRCNFAQGLHRDNLGDEGGARSVLRGVDPNALKHAPALQRQMQLQAAPKIAPAPAAPTLGGGSTRSARMPPPRPREDKEQE